MPHSVIPICNRLLFLAATCAGMLPASPAPVQQALRVDTSGNPTTQLNLGSANVTGTVSPTRLGSGTPSSTTVLRGDGSWVGTTATGNTIAATSNLLMGDGAGNAMVVTCGADLYRVLKARSETQAVTLPNPQNLLPSLSLNLHSSVQNVDGSITIPANGYIEFDNNTNPAAAPLYAYVVATGDVPADTLTAAGYYGGYQAVDQGNVQTRPLPGVVTTTFTNHVGIGSYQFCITNSSASPVTIYYPFLSLSDPGHPLFSSYAEATATGSQSVADLDFTRFTDSDRYDRYLGEKQTTIAADSVSGANTNAGTLYSPKLTLGQTLVQGSVFGLSRGSLFRGSLPVSNNLPGVIVQDLTSGSSKGLPVVSALDPVPNSAFTPNGDGTYTYTWTPAETLVQDGYSNVYVVEINTGTEASLPISSHQRPLDQTTQSAVAATAGSAWVRSTGTNQWTATIRPSDSLAPGSGSYRYEVVARNSPAEWTGTNLRDGAMSGIVLAGSSDGYGPLGAPVRFVGDRLMILHGTTHNAVVGGGAIQRSLFYEQGDPSSFMLAWYTGDGSGVRFDLRDTLFYSNCTQRNRPPVFLIAHTSNASSYDRGDISHCAMIGGRLTNGALAGTGIAYHNVAQGTIDHIYVTGVADVLDDFSPPTLDLGYSIFSQVGRLKMSGRFHDNIVSCEAMNDPDQVNDRGPLGCYVENANTRVINNLFRLRTLNGLASTNTAAFLGFYPGVNPLANVTTVSHNIVVLDASQVPAASAPAESYASLGGLADNTGAGLTMDYNLVVSVGGHFYASAGGANCFSWTAYRSAAPTLDQHSLFVDLSSDPRGLKALFVDPDNGDFRWAQTDIARQCARYCAANGVGPAAVPTHWPLVPSVDATARLLSDL